MNATEIPPERNEKEDMPNNQVIGTAMHAALIVLMIMGLPVIGFLIYLNFQKIQENQPEPDRRVPTVHQANEPQLQSSDEAEADLPRVPGHTGE